MSTQTIYATWLLRCSRTPYAIPLTYVRLHKSRISWAHFFSIEIILVNLIRHHHHPQQKHRPDDVKRKHSFPIVTYPLRLQRRQCRLPVRQSPARPVEVAVAVDGARGAVELDGGFDEAGEEEDEEDEGAEDDDGGKELPLLDQDEDDEEEEEAEGAGGYTVGEYPEHGGREFHVSLCSDCSGFGEREEVVQVWLGWVGGGNVTRGLRDERRPAGA